MRKVLSFIIILIICSSLYFCLSEKNIFSENENRNLSVFPEISFTNFFNGNLTEEIESFVNDHFPFRNELLKIKTKVELYFGKNLINGVFVTDDYLFLKYEENNDLENVVDSLNKFYENNSQIDVKLLLIPSSGFINNEYLPYFTNSKVEENDINYVFDNLLFEVINPSENLLEFNERYDVYFKSDHHYSIYGAYAAYKSFCESNNIEFDSNLKFSLVSNAFYGTLSSKVSSFDSYKDNLYYYKADNIVSVKYNGVEKNEIYDFSFIDKKDKYSFFFGGNHALVEIETSNDLGKEILIVKDSYANSFIPFLTNDYDNIHVIDLRFYNLSITDYVKENNIDEVLFLYSTTGFNFESGLNLLR